MAEMDLAQLITQSTGVVASGDAETITAVSRDASAFIVTPQAVAFPKNAAEIGALVRWVSTEHERGQAISLTPRAGGTDMSGGPLTQSIVVSMEQFDASVSIDAEAKTALVSMGAMYRDLEKEATAHGLLFGAYTSSKDICGVAGMIGNNASGEKSVRFGATIDNTNRIWAVLSDGTEYEFGPLSREEFNRKQEGDSTEAKLYQSINEMLAQSPDSIASLKGAAPKCASGYRLERIYNTSSDSYNLAKLFVGSQGTLGIITKAEMALVSQSAYERLIVASVSDLSQLTDILQTVMAHSPEGVETFDIHTFERAKEFLPEETAVVAPVIADAGLVILGQFAGDEKEAVDQSAQAAADALIQKGCRVSYVDDARMHRSIWKIRRSSYGVFRDHKEGTKHAVPCIEDIIVPIARFGDFIPRLIAILAERDIAYGFHGHIGDGALRIIPVLDMADLKTPERIVDLMRAVFALVKELGGNMSADHSDGIIRTPFLAEFYPPEVMTLFGQVKHIFDPLNIFNPGKKIGGTIAAITDHLIRS